MFQGLINNAKSAVSGLVLKYVARASVAVPFVIALGFALAAIMVLPTDPPANRSACSISPAGVAMAARIGCSVAAGRLFGRLDGLARLASLCRCNR